MDDILDDEIEGHRGSSFYSKIILMCTIVFIIVLLYAAISVSQESFVSQEQEGSKGLQILIFSTTGVGLLSLVLSFVKTEPWNRLRIVGTFLLLTIISIFYGLLFYTYLIQ